MKRARIKFLEPNEIQALIRSAEAGTLDHALMSALWSTGMRVSEALAIETAQIRAMKPDATEQMSIVGKGGWQRLVFFSPESIRAAHLFLDTGASENRGANALLNSRLFPITVRTAERIIDRAVERVGLSGRKITPHTFRHSFATHMLRKGANIRIVQDLLGHKAISSTMVYTGVANKDLLEAHTKFL